MPASKRMGDGRQWTVVNLNVDTRSSYCYGDSEQNCRRYGRLYTWRAARLACRSLGERWRLPTEAEWRELARGHGGVREDSTDEGNGAYNALSIGGSSGFDAVLAGDRAKEGRYERLQAHGFYWTATETAPGSAWFYNFGKGGQSLNRQPEGDERMAASVRCIGD
jgi:uncharacterized protein (TIGR02145 family)